MSGERKQLQRFVMSPVVWGVVGTGILLLFLWFGFVPELGAASILSKPLTFDSPIGNPVLAFDKTADVISAEPGDIVQYTLSYSNTQQDSLAYNVRLYDFLPAGAAYVSASQITTLLPDGVLMFTAPSISPDTGQVDVTVRVRVLPGYEALYNHAMVTADGATPAQDSAVVLMTPATDKLLLTKTGNKATLLGRPLVYTIRCVNDSLVPFNNLWVEDVLPAGVTLTSTSVTPAVTELPVLRWSWDKLNPGMSWEVVITGSAPSSVGIITNVAALYAPSHVPVHTLLTTHVVSEGAILNVEKTASSAWVHPNDLLTYTLRATNEGNVTATNVILTDTFPALITPLNATLEPVSTSSGRWIWELGEIGNGQWETVVITTRVNTAAKGSLLNTAEVGASNAWSGYDDVLTRVDMRKLYLPLIMKVREH